MLYRPDRLICPSMSDGIQPSTLALALLMAHIRCATPLPTPLAPASISLLTDTRRCR